MINDALNSNGGDWSAETQLDLSYRKIAVVENIVCFNSLTTLSLSNNRIKEASNLDHLVSLTSLDLSFNKIENLPRALASLVNLRELSLHSNQLKELSTIDKFDKLSVLNLGRNQISSLDTFLPLRKLPHLRALMAAGNPCAEKNMDDYEAFVLAYLGSQVRWLDYRVVDTEKVAACREQFQNELETLISSEDIKKAEIAQAETDKITQAALKEIYMLEAATLFDMLIKKDEFLPKISRMEGLTDLEEILKTDLTVIVENLRTEMTTRCAAIKADVDEFMERLNLVYANAQGESVTLIKGLKRSRKYLFARDLQCSLPPRIEFIGQEPPSDMALVDRRLRSFKAEVVAAREELEALETNTQSSALALVDRFEDNYSSMMTSLTEILQDFFQKAMNLANKFYDSLKDLAVNTIAAFGDELGDELPPPVAEAGTDEEDGPAAPPVDGYLVLLSNVDAMMEVVNGSHEKHESIILGYDEKVRRSVREKLQSDLIKFKENEFERSRVVVKDIVDTCKELVGSADQAYETVKAKMDLY